MRKKNMEIKKELKDKYEKYVKINQDDAYSKCVVDCGEIFGNFIDEGKTFDEAQKMMLDTKQGNGITGFMMGALMLAVCHFHPKGEEIKKWWNKENGREEAKGVINPALIEIKS